MEEQKGVVFWDVGDALELRLIAWIADKAVIFASKGETVVQEAQGVRRIKDDVELATDSGDARRLPFCLVFDVAEEPSKWRLLDQL